MGKRISKLELLIATASYITGTFSVCHKSEAILNTKKHIQIIRFYVSAWYVTSYVNCLLASFCTAIVYDDFDEIHKYCL